MLPLPTATQPVNLPGLENVVAFTKSFYSGAVPIGEQGFATLKAMGIKTLISVDGAKPQLKYAKKYGLRYVHLPIGYDAVSKNRSLELARAARDLPGPFYIHCHHGKHRSAGATAVVSVMLGDLTPFAAIKRMHVSGTSLHYKGLFASVSQAVLVSDAVLDSASNAFPQVWQTRNLVDAMVAIDQVADHLKAIKAAGWKPPVNAPDLLPIAEAGRLADLLKNLGDDKQVSESAQMRDWILASSADASVLENQLMADKRRTQKLDEQLKRVLYSCTRCHEKYRN
ncbi:MAG: hypothetical protein JKX85_14425 [Phycisphaeraceae bacterium]|nr:hypothetical protein [Phycisphaeraceae bacterium]